MYFKVIWYPVLKTGCISKYFLKQDIYLSNDLCNKHQIHCFRLTISYSLVLSIFHCKNSFTTRHIVKYVVNVRNRNLFHSRFIYTNCILYTLKTSCIGLSWKSVSSCWSYEQFLNTSFDFWNTILSCRFRIHTS